VFLKGEAEGKLDPLFGLKGQMGIRPPIPAIVSRFVGDAKIFVEVSGTVSASGKIGRDQCANIFGALPITGKIAASINAELKAIPSQPPPAQGSGQSQSYFLSVTAKAGTDISLTFTPEFNQASGVLAKYKADLGPLKGELSASVSWGDIQWKGEVTFLPGGSLIPETTTVLID
jgi:hypothetical protein